MYTVESKCNCSKGTYGDKYIAKYKTVSMWTTLKIGELMNNANSRLQ